MEDCRAMSIDCDVADADDALFFQERMQFRDYLERVRGYNSDGEFQIMDEREYMFGPLYRNSVR